MFRFTKQKRCVPSGLMLERTTRPYLHTPPDSIKCPKCGKYGKGPLVRENGDVHVQHRVSKERPKNPSGNEIHSKRTIYCLIAKGGKPA